MLVIGVCGRAKNGKSEAADALAGRARQKGMNVQSYDIGGEVLSFCIADGRLPAKKREDLDKKELDVLVRTGKEMREVRETFWIDRLTERMLSTYPDVAVIPNIRYQNETQWVQRLGGKTIRVKALNPDGSEFISYDRDPNHPSETELHNFAADFYITAHRGQPDLVRSLAVSIFDYVYGKVLQ